MSESGRESMSTSGDSGWPKEAVFAERQVVRLKNPENSGGDSRFIADEMVGMIGVVIGTDWHGTELVYSVALEMGGMPWGIPGKLLETDGEISAAEVPSLEDDYVGRRAEVVRSVPETALSAGDVVEIAGVSVTEEDEVVAFAVRTPRSDTLMMLDASDVTLL